ncbi:uncharacterized protein [Procambarus clarkii]|uniref:uncharacterized protein isoform X1 n=1 Tax=Procambarus clarkii TaxID=6728 RepID=UPI003743C13E
MLASCTRGRMTLSHELPTMDTVFKRNFGHFFPISDTCKYKLVRHEIVDGSNGTLCIYDDGIIFTPPLYQQRYKKVMDKIISVSKGVFTKVVDIGCADLKFFRYLLNVPGIQEIVLLDKDAHVLKVNEYRINPFAADFLMLRRLPLNVKAVCGDARNYDPLLCGTQVITMIELIEHMKVSELPELVRCVFKDISPKLVIITTPNADFNKFIPDHIPGSFRHWDHKFEWTAEEFHQWCQEIVQNNSGYYLELSGCGLGPENTYCTQMAVFVQSSLGQENLLPCFIKEDVAFDTFYHKSVCTEEISESAAISDVSKNSFTIISEFDYPLDTRTQEEQDRDHTLARFHTLKAYLYSREQSLCLDREGNTEVVMRGERTEDTRQCKAERKKLADIEQRKKKEDILERNIKNDFETTNFDLDELPLGTLSLKSQLPETTPCSGDGELIYFATEHVESEEAIDWNKGTDHEFFFFIINDKYAVIPGKSLSAWVNNSSDHNISNNFISLAVEDECFEVIADGENWQVKIQLWEESDYSAGENKYDEDSAEDVNENDEYGCYTDDEQSSNMDKFDCECNDNVETPFNFRDEDWDWDRAGLAADVNEDENWN